jgi:hypothetical protein
MGRLKLEQQGKVEQAGVRGNEIREVAEQKNEDAARSAEAVFSIEGVVDDDRAALEAAVSESGGIARALAESEIRAPGAEVGESLNETSRESTEYANQEFADAQTAAELIQSEGAKIVSFIEQAERDRVIRNTMRYEEKDLAVMVADIFGGCLHFPTGYQFKKKTSDFIWIADEKQYTIQGVFVYRYPALGTKGDFSKANIIAHRNEVLRNNAPGMFENTYMTTGTLPEPSVEYIKYQGRSFAQTRGYWEVANDYMGGPFVSHSFYSPDGIYVIVCDAFVYAPKFDKRQYLRQVESLLYSWEWKEKSEEN